MHKQIKTLNTKRDYEEWHSRLRTAVTKRKAQKYISGEGLLSLFGLAPDKPATTRGKKKAQVHTLGQYAS